MKEMLTLGTSINKNVQNNPRAKAHEESQGSDFEGPNTHVTTEPPTDLTAVAALNTSLVGAFV